MSVAVGSGYLSHLCRKIDCKRQQAQEPYQRERMEDSAMEKRHFVLVHGMGHGAWCWYKLSTLLCSAGHRVTAMDLAASGIDPRKLEEISTFAEYSQPLIDIMSSLPPEEKVILVGHSFGGMNIAFAMERFPERIAAAVFVSAFMPDSTSRPSYVLEKHAQEFPLPAMDNHIRFDKGLGSVPTSLLFGPQFLSSRLYQRCPAEDITLAMSLVRAASSFSEDISCAPTLSKDRYGSVDSVYVVCAQDLGIAADFQRWMAKNNSVEQIKEIEEADHMSMLSRPQELYRCLLDIANTHA